MTLRVILNMNFKMNFEIVDPCPGSAQFGLDLVPTNFFVPFFFYALRLLHYR